MIKVYDCNSNSIYVNPKHIIYVEQNPNYSGSVIYFTNERTLQVHDNSHDIYKMIMEYKNKTQIMLDD
jgi:uncharacterized protein YlzI (FlbEa/FlbD family)